MGTLGLLVLLLAAIDPQATITGRDLHFTGTPGTEVRLYSERETLLARGTIDRDGRLTFKGQGAADPMLRIVELDKKRRALSELFPAVELLAALPDRVASGLSLHPHVRVRARRGGEPAENIEVAVSIACGGEPKILGSMKSDRFGVAVPSAPFEVPSSLSGACVLSVRAAGARLDHSVEVSRGARLMLSVDRPVYQPGDEVYLRGLVLDQSTGRPIDKAAATIELRHANGAVLARREVTSDAFGLFNTRIRIDANLESPNLDARITMLGQTASTTFKVGRFTPARATAEIALDKNAYAPKAKLKARVTVARLDGGPTAGAQVRLTLESLAGALHHQAGATADESGVAVFELALPNLKEAQLLRAKAELAAGESAEGTREVLIDAGGLAVYAVPESGAIVPRVENGFWIVTVADDGTPAPSKVTLTAGKSKTAVETDQSGIAWASLHVPAAARAVAIKAESLREGRASSASVAVPEVKEGLLLHVDPPIVGADHRLRVALKTGDEKARTAIVDLIAEDHPVESRAIALERGVAAADFVLPGGIAGTLRVHAWYLGQDNRYIEDTRLVLVDDRRDLTIELLPDRAAYLPGDEATIAVKVSDASGAPQIAALGLVAVDEGLRAFGLEDPQLERAVARLGTLWKPRREDAPAWAERALFLAGDRQRLAVLSSASLTEFQLSAPEESGPARAQAAAAAFQPAIDRRGESLARSLEKFYQESAERRKRVAGIDELVANKVLSRSAIEDPWSNVLAIDQPAEIEGVCGAMLGIRSNGVDGIRGTEDDIESSIEFNPDPSVGCAAGFGSAVGGLGFGRVGSGMGGGGHGYGVGVNYRAPRIRSHFPSTLAVVPSLITDAEGRATWRLKLADSLTRWVLLARGVSREGGLGGAEAIVRVEQTFSVDAHLPPSLTREDELDVPIEVTNNQTVAKRVTVRARADGSLSGSLSREVEVGPRSTSISILRVRAPSIGEGAIHVEAIAQDGSADAVKRTLLVEAEGVPVSETRTGRIAAKKRAAEKILVSADGVPGSQKLALRLYPSSFGAVVEGLDALLQMPSGCFEQTSATTYPNALVLDYLQSTRRSNAAVKLRATAMLEAGWNLLRSYEVPGGGFSWFGDAPANRILTAFGIMEFAGIDRVYPIDEDTRARTRRWLLSAQEADGSFPPDEAYLHEESWSRVQNAKLASTAYIAWALARYGGGEELLRAAAYLRSHPGTDDAYVQALLALALTTIAREDPAATAARAKLAKMVKPSEQGASWVPAAATNTYASGDSAVVETTALAVLAFHQGGDQPILVQDGLRWLNAKREPGGGWSTTQSTVLALEALLETEKKRAPAVGQIVVRANGKVISRTAITQKDSDIAKTIELPATPGEHAVDIAFQGTGILQYQLASTRNTVEPQEDPSAPLELAVRFDRREVELGSAVLARVKLSARDQEVRMPTVSIGLPAGFQLDDRHLKHHPALAKHEVLGRKVILYLTQLAAKQEVDFELSLVATRGGRLSAGVTSAWPYYDPEQIRRVDGGRFEVGQSAIAGR